MTSDLEQEREHILHRGFLDQLGYRERTRLTLPIEGAPGRFATLDNGAYLCVRGTRRDRRHLMMLTVRDAMMQHRGVSIVAILPRESDFRWLVDLHEIFSRRDPDGPDGAPPGWDSDWKLRVLPAGADADQVAAAMAGIVDLVLVDGVESLTPQVRSALAGSQLLDDSADAHDPLIDCARRSDAAVVGGIDTTSPLLSEDRRADRDGVLDLVPSGLAGLDILRTRGYSAETVRGLWSRWDGWSVA